MLRLRLLLTCLLPFALSAATVFISPSGDDANPGTLAQPFRTIQHGVNLLQPGDTCFVR
ncbi:MAG: pectate lyase, partial [Victivallales bacterium]|nr:pectate lyase [Victivallales bacterium]